MPSEAMADFRAAGVTSVYKPRQVVFTAGNPCSGLYLVCHGAVKLYHSDRFGRDHILEIAGPRAVLGELAGEPDQLLSVSAEALTETQLSFLPRDRLVQFLAKYPMTGVRMLEALSRELALARRKVRDLALKRADSRLAALLLQMAAGDDGLAAKQVRLDYSRRELAEMIGVSTETAIRLLAKFQREKVISINRRAIVFDDLAKLTRVANYGDVEE
jgi:CRP/FNR family transcriptional regulator/CRP/FNR family cyclic AMP-dependent transcriptional regulator